MQLKQFVILCISFLSIVESNAQVGVQTIPTSNQENSIADSFLSPSSFQISSSIDKYYNLVGSEDDVALTIEQPTLGLFCKLDKSLDQKFPFNLRFRLGEYHYTNGLEYGDELGRRASSLPIKNKAIKQY